jgi:hypothetical protein
VFVSTNSGENLLVGNSENTKPLDGRNVDISSYESVARAMDEVERDRYYRDQAIQYILGHPLESSKMYLLKVVNYFNYRNNLVTTKGLLRIYTDGSLLSFLVIFFLRLFINHINYPPGNLVGKIT